MTDLAAVHVVSPYINRVTKAITKQFNSNINLYKNILLEVHVLGIGSC